MNFPKTKENFKKNELKILLIIGLILIGGLFFQAGYLKGQKIAKNPLIIETCDNCPAFETKAAQAKNEDPGATPETNIPKNETQECMFVGSKNSTKYHLPTCSSAKRIKEENLVCFESAEDAVSKGYEPSKDCLK